MAAANEPIQSALQLDRAILDGKYLSDSPLPVWSFDTNTLGWRAVLPKGSKVLAVERYGTSSWASTARIDTETANGSQKGYFLKVSGLRLT